MEWLIDPGRVPQGPAVVLYGSLGTAALLLAFRLKDRAYRRLHRALTGPEPAAVSESRSWSRY